MSFDDADLRLSFDAGLLADAANSFARAGVLRVPELFPGEVAEALYQHFETDLEWRRAVSQGDDTLDLTPELIAQMIAAKDHAFIDRVHAAARDGFQFLFDSVIVSDKARERKARGLLLDRVVEALNHHSSLNTFRAITGEPKVRQAVGQATRYLPGHFLTAHDDSLAGENRVAAFVINLTKDWRPDWGGLLQFQNAGGDVPLSLKPGFNTIHLFRVPQMHSVSYVAPFAGAPRYAITGWLLR
ncbi:2OG-Fe(II) oxygenase [Novosphingobium bradum]|uniref:2OG-Fe(II) oxygenase n=1 Tax=Novosphingobium bradum TaxID=1737444 RepID=A0ABV7IQB6_9SPHN